MKEIENRLVYLGITPNLRGFGYICDAIELAENSSYIKMEDVYACVSEKHKSANRSSIERAIRYSITKVNKERWKSLGGNGVTNSEFLSTLALMARKG